MSACPWCGWTAHHHPACLGGCMSVRAPALHDGATLEPRDQPRLATQQERVRELMSDGRWWTLADLAERVGASEAGVSARVRDLRKAKFGGYEVERRRLGNGFEYRMVTREAA